MSSLQQKKLKLIIAGDHAVGKTSLTKSYLGMNFSPKYIPTMGVDILTKSYKYENYIVDLRIWDLAGQILYRDLSGSYIKGADIVIIVFDVTRTESFFNVEGWYKKIFKVLEKSGAQNTPCLLVGNKIDLKNERVVTMDQGLKISEELDCLYIETSAKENVGVDEAFNKLVIEFIKISKTM